MARTYGRIEDKYGGLLPDTKEYLNLIPLIIDISNNVSRNKDKDIFDILIAYLFIKVEHGQRRIFYGLAINRHNVNKHAASVIIKKWHIDQIDFIILYRILSGKRINQKILGHKKKAADVRNDIFHGKIVDDADKAMAIKAILDYIGELNEHVLQKYKFKPFGNMKGFRVRSEPNNDEESNKTLRKIKRILKKAKPRYKQPLNG